MTFRLEFDAQDLLDAVYHMSQDKTIHVEREAYAQGQVCELEKQLEEKNRQIKDLERQLEFAAQNPRKPEWAFQMRQLISHTVNGNKIAAIKIVRDVTGLGLKESKDLFEGARKERWTWDLAKGGYVCTTVTTKADGRDVIEQKTGADLDREQCRFDDGQGS